MKKPRADSVLDQLPENQRAALEAWLFTDKLSYLAAQKKLWEDFNVRVSSSALSSFWQRSSQERLMQKIATSIKLSNNVAATFKANSADFYDSLVNMAGKIAFDKAMDSDQELDAETIFNFTKLVMAARKQQLEADAGSRDERRIKLLEKKAEAFDQVKQAVNAPGGLTPETLSKIERELKLL